MKDFEYQAPTTVEQAIGLLAERAGARVLTGGTDLLVQLREGMREASLVVDVKRIPALTSMSFSPEQGLRLGAAVPCYRVYGDADVRAAYPALADAARIIGGWQIQSRASIGGNLCNSSPAADSIPALLVHHATCHIAGARGTRTTAAADFCTAPGRNVLERGELLTMIELPPQPPRASSAYLRFIPRNEMDIAVVGAASWVELDESGSSIRKARVALAAVAPTPLPLGELSAWLAGRPATAETFDEAARQAAAAVRPISDKRGTAGYRKHLAGVLTRRTLAIAVERARGRA